MNNVYLIDKPEDWTSFDIVKKLRKVVGTKKAGHAGTLDPFATGLLIVCTGNFTRLSEYFHRYLKTYKAVFVLGEFKDTDDKTGETIKSFNIPDFNRSDIEKALKNFVGEIEQVPPYISAKKVNGQRLYKLNRNERKVKPVSTRVFVKDIKLLSFNSPEIEVEITCGTGTYIRSIARDLGETLNCGCYVSFLRRTAIGPYSVDKAHGIDSPSPIPQIDIFPEIEAIVPDGERLRKILSGNEVFIPGYFAEGEKVRVFTPFFKEFAAFCSVKKQKDGVILKPEKVFLTGEM